MLKTKQKAGTRNPLNDAEKEYIRQNHHNTSVVDMSRHLKRTAGTIYLFMDAEELTVYNTKPQYYQRRVPDKVKPGCFDINSMAKMF